MAGGGGYDRSLITTHLGTRWSYVSPGISIRQFPSGNLTHPAMCKLQELVLEHGISADQVDHVEVRTNRQMPINLTYHKPETGLQGKFSMEFCLAAILLFGRAGLTEFTDEVVNRADVQDTITKIRFNVYSDAEAVAESYKLLTSFVVVEMRNGQRFSARIDAAKGTPDYPMSDDEIKNMFRDRAAFAGLQPDQTEKLIGLIENIEKLRDIHELSSLLQAGT